MSGISSLINNRTASGTSNHATDPEIVSSTFVFKIDFQKGTLQLVLEGLYAIRVLVGSDDCDRAYARSLSCGNPSFVGQLWDHRGDQRSGCCWLCVCGVIPFVGGVGRGGMELLSQVANLGAAAHGQAFF